MNKNKHLTFVVYPMSRKMSELGICLDMMAERNVYDLIGNQNSVFETLKYSL